VRTECGSVLQFFESNPRRSGAKNDGLAIPRTNQFSFSGLR